MTQFYNATKLNTYERNTNCHEEVPELSSEISTFMNSDISPFMNSKVMKSAAVLNHNWISSYVIAPVLIKSTRVAMMYLHQFFNEISIAIDLSKDTVRSSLTICLLMDSSAAKQQEWNVNFLSSSIKNKKSNLFSHFFTKLKQLSIFSHLHWKEKLNVQVMPCLSVTVSSFSLPFLSISIKQEASQESCSKQGRIIGKNKSII